MARSIAVLAVTTAIVAAADRSVWDGIYSEAQATRGEGAYVQYCVSCHGSRLEGGEMSPPLAGVTFTANWSDLTVGELFERIRTTMPLNRPEVLSRQQNADVTAFILKANKWPSGSADMPADLAALETIRIHATRR